MRLPVRKVCRENGRVALKEQCDLLSSRKNFLIGAPIRKPMHRNRKSMPMDRPDVPQTPTDRLKPVKGFLRQT